MAKRTYYEWDIESSYVDTSDIWDHDFRDRLDDFPAKPIEPRSDRDGRASKAELVLVRDVWDEDAGGLLERQWAYVKDNVLPAEFDGGNKVPARFHAEFKAWVAHGGRA